MTRLAVICLWGLLELFFLFNFTSSDHVYFDDPPVVYTYNRLPEIEKECGPFLSSANSKLQPDDGRGYRIKKELSFFQGNWVQEVGDSPLVPFDDSDLPREPFTNFFPLRLVGFELKDVNPVHLLQNAVSLCGTMCIGMARNSSLVYNSRSPFYISPGMSVLKIAFEGVYVETENNGGQRLLCMLGNTSLPFPKLIHEVPGKFSSDDSFSDSKFRFLQDGRLLLVLRYPQIFSLTKRAILGELTSLNEPGKPGYFEPVRITSQLSRFSRYEFSSEILKSKTCNFSLYLDEFEEDGAKTFNNSEICQALRQFSGRSFFKIVPNWRFTGRVVFRSFFWGQESKPIEKSYENVSLTMQNIICEQEKAAKAMENRARVAAVLRVIPAGLDQDTATMMTGLSEMTLSVEGTWDASKGQLCMVGCPGVGNSGLEGCDSRVSLYFPRSFSIKQRSSIFGSISSFSTKSNSYDPILFDMEVRPSNLWYDDGHGFWSNLSYNYSKIELARAVRSRNQPHRFSRAIRQLFLSYPGGRSLFAGLISAVKHISQTFSTQHQDKADLSAHLEVISLRYDLSFSCYGIPIPSHPSHKPETFVEVDVLTLGPSVIPRHSWIHYDGGQPLKNDILNVSLSLVFTEAPLKFKERNYKNISTLFLEGLYDSVTGQMHLIGCRKLTFQSLNLNLERGLDCLLEVEISYPAETMRWLINPKASITISSQRSEGDDTLFFQPIKLETSVLRSGDYKLDAVFRKLFEEILRNLMIAASIALISSQLLYTKENVDAIPYISRLMLSFQCLGYLFPLISNSKVLLREKEYHSPRNFYGHEDTLTLLEYTQKILALAALVLTVTLSRKVAESREKPHLHLPYHSRGAPCDKKFRFVNFVVLVIGYFGYCYLSGGINAIEDAQVKNIWTCKTQEFIGLVQDLFLLPQIIENMKWETYFRPLRKLYYVGFTLMRLGLRLCDHIRDPLVDPYSSEIASRDLDLFFAPTIPNLAVVIIMTGSAVFLYIQQKESQQKLIEKQNTISAKSR